jgi:hypothetical protein
MEVDVDEQWWGYLTGETIGNILSELEPYKLEVSRHMDYKILNELFQEAFNGNIRLTVVYRR